MIKSNASNLRSTLFSRKIIWTVVPSSSTQQYKNVNDLSNVSTIRSLSSQSIDDDLLPNDLSDFQTSQLIRTNQIKRGYFYPKSGIDKRPTAVNCTELDIDYDDDLTREMSDYQRSFSEGRLIDKWVNIQSMLLLCSVR